MRIDRIILMASALALLAGCMSPPRIPEQAFTGRTEPQVPWATFDEQTLQRAAQPGHAIIRGQAFSKTVGGDVKYGAGNLIVLAPESDYIKQCLLILADTDPNSPCAARIKPYLHHVEADGEGRFEFVDISPGTYRLSTVIMWGVPGPYGITTTGGEVTAVVEVKSDVDVITKNLD